MAKRTSMVFVFEWIDRIEAQGFRKEVLDEVALAAIAYGREGRLPDGLKPLTRMAMANIAPEIDEYRRRYEERCAHLDRIRKRKQTDEGVMQSDERDTHSDEGVMQSDERDTHSDEGDTQSDERDTHSDEGVMQSDACVTHTDERVTHAFQGVNNEYMNYDNINLSLPRVREELKNIFLGPISCDQYMKRWDTTREELARICDEVLEDWIALGEPKKDMSDAKRHFQGAVRYKYEQKIKNGNEKSGNGGRSARSGAPSRQSREGAYGVVD